MTNMKDVKMEEPVLNMKDVKMEKLVLNCGGLGEKLERSVNLLKYLTGKEPIKTLSRKRIPTFGTREGLEIGCKVTLRGKKADELITRLLAAIGNKLSNRQIGNGTVSFGVHEYIEIPGVQFQREIGILGLDASITLKRAGFCVSKRKHAMAKIPLRHRITKEETANFMIQKFNTQIQ